MFWFNPIVLQAYVSIGGLKSVNSTQICKALV